MSEIAPLLEKSKKVWKDHLGQFNAPGASWDNERWREPFELIGASLIYTYNAIKLMPDIMRHKTVRLAMQDPQGIWKLLKGKEPDFPQNVDDKFNELVSTMHMASSSFRLSTALCLIEKEILNATTRPLAKFLNNPSDDWNRGNLKKYRKDAAQLKCCKNNNPLNDEKMALAMIVDHRDEFGHGEEGREKDRNERSEFISQLHICRIFEAQLLLAELGVKELSQIK